MLAGGLPESFVPAYAELRERRGLRRAERLGELVNQTFYYDGTSLSVNLPDEKYFATMAARSAERVTGTRDCARFLIASFA